ncbi:unnamed protein product [Rotaria sp. Silwood1]|nr:unnamed protein product [Rotaria sp. Silwood1]CAF0743421.1 unnamed protein product [Rotaria sp. Silwood1]CAF0799221.1 unnamed protein product [Rotaria sp. Silwood1]CAF3334434.1 unnamed protein product [Rotaria sp. Silwood1]CAF3336046.1 unnamed protein product [Rotaria sp. Silwood1]
MAESLKQFHRPTSASTVATNWSQGTSTSIGHNVSHRHIPVIKGDVNFVNTSNTTEATGDDDAVPSHYIKEILDRLSKLPVDSIDHEDALEFIYDLFYMHSPLNQDDSRIARVLIECDYCSIVHRCLIEFMKTGIFSNASIRRSTQFILYTLWNFTGISMEFRVYVSNNGTFVKFLLINVLEYLKNLKTEQNLATIKDNLIQSIISIIHNLSININHLNIEQTFHIINQLLFEQKPIKSTERFRVTLLLCLINLNGKQVYENINIYQSTFKLLFYFLKKIVQHEILMISTGLSAWVIAYAINKMPIDIVLTDDNRLYSFMILFKRGMREEKLQAGFTLNRCIQKSTHAKEIIEKDGTCWNLFQQFKVFLHEEQNI